VSSRKLHNRSPHSEEENRSDAHDEHCQEREITSSSTQNFEIATLDQDRTSYASLSHKVKGSLIKVGRIASSGTVSMNLHPESTVDPRRITENRTRYPVGNAFKECRSGLAL
jgi:hypothetical protein